MNIHRRISIVYTIPEGNKQNSATGVHGELLVRPGKVVYSSGCKSRSGKAGQPPDRELWVGGGDAKD
jgi:hypothetical protein